MIDHELEAAFKRLRREETFKRLGIHPHRLSMLRRAFWLMDLGLIETAWISSPDFILYYTENQLSQMESYWISTGYSTGDFNGI